MASERSQNDKMSLTNLNIYDLLFTELSLCNRVLTCIKCLDCYAKFHLNLHNTSIPVYFFHFLFFNKFANVADAVLHNLFGYFWKETVMRVPKVVYGVLAQGYFFFFFK